MESQPPPEGPQSPQPGPPSPPPAPEQPGQVPPPQPGVPPAPPAYTGPVPPGGWQQPVQQPAFPYPLATWGSRVAAQLIDWFIIGIPATIIFVGLILGAVGVTGNGNDSASAGAIIGAILLGLLLVLVLICIYAPLTMRREGKWNGATWGKQLLGIRAIRDNGVPFDYGYAALREVVVKDLALWLISSIIPLIPYLLDYLWPLWDDSNRALHDMVCSTHVVQA